MMIDDSSGGSGTNALVPSGSNGTTNGRVLPPPVAYRSDAPRSRPEEPESFNPAVVIHSLRRHWPLAMVAGLLLAPLLAYAGWHFLIPMNSAVAYLRIDSVDAPLLFQTADRSGGGRNSFGLYKNTQSQLIKTPFVLNKALADPTVTELAIVQQQPDPLQWLSNEVVVKFPGDGEVMAISLEMENGRQAKTIVDAVVKAYMDEAVLDERNERLQRVDNLERVYAEAEGKVRARRADIRKLADTLGTGDSQSLSLAQQSSVNRYGQVLSELSNLDFQLLTAQSELESYRQMSQRFDARAGELAAVIDRASDTDDAAARQVVAGQDAAKKLEAAKKVVQPDSETESDEVTLSDYEQDRLLMGDQTYQRMVSENRQLSDEIALYRTRFGEGMIRPRKDQLDRLNDSMAQRKIDLLRIAKQEKTRRLAENGQDAFDLSLTPEQQAAVQERSKIKIKKEEQDNLIAAREIRVGVLQQQRALTQEVLAKLEEETKKLGRSSIDIEMMRAEIAALEEVLSNIGGEIQRTKIELKSDSRITVISDATTVAGEKKKRYMATAGLGFLGFCLPFAGLIGLDLSRRHVNDTDSIGRDLMIPVLGAVPHQRQVSQMVHQDTFASGEFGNSVSGIVAMLVNLARFEGTRVIMVTSATSGEGKSTLAASLWRGLIESQFKAVLVDLDLRRPTIHEQFGVEPGDGVAEVLTGKRPLSKVIQKRGPLGAYVTAGTARRINLSSVSKSRLPKMLDDLRDSYDYVIVDTPPLLPVVDARLIGENVDAAVLAVMRDRSRVPQMIAANEILKAHGVPVMGVVVNACSSKNGKYSYKY